MQQHSLARLFPPMSGSQFALFKADIQSNGQKEPIVLYDDMILDGCNRHRACVELGLEPKFTDFAGEDPFSFVMSSNLARRHLNESQRAMVGARIANMHAGDNQHAGPADRRDLSQSEAAIQVNTSERMVSRAKKVMREGNDRLNDIVDAAIIPLDGALKLINAEDADEIIDYIESQPDGKHPSVNEARKAIRQSHREEDREQMAQEGKSIAPSDRYTIYHSDLANFEAEHSYDWIITDPPYPKEFLPLFETLYHKSKEWLKPGGLLVIMSGQQHFSEVMQYLKDDYYWLGAYLTPNHPTPLRQRQVNTSWKPIIFVAPNGHYNGKIFGDVFKSTYDGKDKDAHKWGQSVDGMVDMVQRLCLPGERILDPFCGAGSTGIAALKHGCLFDGVEIDESNVSISRLRCGEYINGQESK